MSQTPFDFGKRTEGTLKNKLEYKETFKHRHIFITPDTRHILATKHTQREVAHKPRVVIYGSTSRPEVRVQDRF